MLLNSEVKMQSTKDIITAKILAQNPNEAVSYFRGRFGIKGYVIEEGDNNAFTVRNT